MLAATAHSVTNTHYKDKCSSPPHSVLDLLRTWIQRSRSRQQLGRLTERDLHDVGLSRSDQLYEIEKPFWRK
jgi:uncharacterized protein YjiS (DUF1127 family)